MLEIPSLLIEFREIVRNELLRVEQAAYKAVIQFCKFTGGFKSEHSRDSVVGRSSSPGMVKNFLHAVQTDSGVHPSSYPMGTGRSFPGGKMAGA
jgi:hypothetical protein